MAGVRQRADPRAASERYVPHLVDRDPGAHDWNRLLPFEKSKFANASIQSVCVRSAGMRILFLELVRVVLYGRDGDAVCEVVAVSFRGGQSQRADLQVASVFQHSESVF